MVSAVSLPFPPFSPFSLSSLKHLSCLLTSCFKFRPTLFKQVPLFQTDYRKLNTITHRRSKNCKLDTVLFFLGLIRKKFTQSIDECILFLLRIFWCMQENGVLTPWQRIECSKFGLTWSDAAYA